MQNEYAARLSLPLNKLLDFGEVRQAYKAQMALVLRNREQRVKLNRAYSEVCAKIFKSSLSELEMMIISGDLQGLKKALTKDKKLLNAKVNQYPIIYLAVRAGHYDIVEFLLKSGCNLCFKDCMSTPMHCAAYYGHYNLIPLLLMYGMPIDIRNKFDKMAIEQATNPQIKNLLTIVKGSRIQKLNQQLLLSEVSHSLINIADSAKKIVVKKIISRNYFKFYNHNSYEDAFHGTKFESLHSIMNCGLKKPGDVVNGKKLDIVEGHIPLGAKFQGKQNWSHAIFISPSVYYAAHPVYSKQFIENNDHTAWLPLVQTRVKKGSYSRHDHTLAYYDPKTNEPTSLQFRVQGANKEQNLIMRSENSESVIVIAALFIKKGYLDEQADYEKVTKIMLDSNQERQFRKLNT